jgi:hypothetical protein
MIHGMALPLGFQLVTDPNVWRRTCGMPAFSTRVRVPRAPDDVAKVANVLRRLLASLSGPGRLLAAFAYGFLCLVMFCAALPTYAAEDDWTVVTIARDGSWGIGISPWQSGAIAAAVGDCTAKAATPNDCGALFKATRGGWIVAELCGDQRIIATAQTLEEAEQESLRRQIDLEFFHLLRLPRCKRLVTINPRGAIVAQTWRARADGSSVTGASN